MNKNLIKLVFEGSSDDTFGETNHFNDTYCSASHSTFEWMVGNEDHTIIVTGEYCPGHSGSWMIGVANYDPNGEDLDFPNWNMKIQPQDYRNGFQPCLLIETPSDVTIKCLQRDIEDEQ